MTEQYLIFANHKGGVGKSTLAGLTAIALASSGKSVVLGDLDPQSAGSDSLPETFREMWEPGLTPTAGRILAVPQVQWGEAAKSETLATADVTILDMPAGILADTTWPHYREFFAVDLNPKVIVPLQFSSMDVPTTGHFVAELARLGLENPLVVINALKQRQMGTAAIKQLGEYLRMQGAAKAKVCPVAIGHWAWAQTLSEVTSYRAIRKEQRDILDRFVKEVTASRPVKESKRG